MPTKQETMTANGIDKGLKPLGWLPSGNPPTFWIIIAKIIPISET